MKGIKNFFALFVAAGKRWSADKASVLAAALAFYTGLALSPLLIVLVVIAGLFLQDGSVQETIQLQVTEAAGADAAELIGGMMNAGFDSSSGATAALLSLATVFFSASGLFAQLENAFNVVWRDSAKPRAGIVGFLVGRLKAFAMVFSIGFLLIMTVVISTVFSAVTQFIGNSPDLIQEQLTNMNLTIDVSLLDRIVSAVLPSLDILLSIVILTFVFGWMFRSVPRVDLTSRDVRGGAIITAILFILGKYGLAIYLSRGSVGSAYGAAGSLLVLLVWVYYSAQIMLFGAEYTYVDAHKFGTLSAQSDASATIDDVATA